MRVVICASVTEEEARRLAEHGPRRDFVELAHATRATIVFRGSRPRRRGALGRLTGPHIAHAWRAAAEIRDGDAVFADGEHVGLPLLAFLRLRRRRARRVVMLGHLPGRRWKRLLLRALTRLGTPGHLVVHSVEQADLVRPALARSWSLELAPYQVDTDYWHRDAGRPSEGDPLVIAAGSEHRDYETLVRAVEGLPVRVLIAAGSHWARETAGASSLPANVEYLSRPLPFEALRDRYAGAAVVAVPLHDVPNQSGVTTILEGMSMALPVVVSATRGQRECVEGPLVRADRSTDPSATADRGPHHFEGAPPSGGPATGLYVPPGDPAALRAAILLLLEDPAWRDRLGRSGRERAQRSFTLERFVATLRGLLLEGHSPGSVATSSRPVERRR